MADAWGIDLAYHHGHWGGASPEVRAALLAAMGVADPSAVPAAEDPVRVVRQGRPGEATAWHDSGTLHLEDGGMVRLDGHLPPDVPLGYHQFESHTGRRMRVIVAPAKCLLPPGRSWAWVAQLYATRSGGSWGIGDLEDLRQLGSWATETGADYLMINPLGAAAPVLPQEASPYYPSSRCYRNPLFLRIEEVPGAAGLGVRLEALARAGHSLNARRKIDRDAVFRLKYEALEAIWEQRAANGAAAGEAAFAAYCQREGQPLQLFAAYCALAELYGGDWRAWPEQFRVSHSPAVERFIAERRGRVRFHQWLQWLLDVQLARAAETTKLLQDLPVGVHPGGADAWVWQEMIAQGCSVGAPPDAFNSKGQDWAIVAFVPHRLRCGGYEPFIQTIRSTLRHSRGLRIDHVMALFRLYWIPAGFGPANAAYVRYNADELLGIVALESQRAGAVVIGEDLGNVEPGVRERLAEEAILSYRVLLFQDQPPPEYPELAMAAATTHDLPTIAGLWTCGEPQAEPAPLAHSTEALYGMRSHVNRVLQLPDHASADEAVETTYSRLGTAPSLVVAATVEDALSVRDQTNVPGTTTEWPNWSLAVPGGIEALQRAELPQKIARALERKPSAGEASC